MTSAATLLLVLGCSEGYTTDHVFHQGGSAAPGQDTADQDGEDQEEEDDKGEEDPVDQEGELFIDEGAPFRLEQRHTRPAEQATVWNGLAEAADGFYLSTMFGGELVLDRYALDLARTGERTVIATSADLVENGELADHAMIRTGSSLYFAASTHSAEDLYLFQTDLDGNRLGYTVLQEAGDTRTNDPHLVSGEGTVCTRWGSSGGTKTVQCLEDSSPFEVETPLNTPQLGTTLYNDGEYWTFTGDEEQRNLVYTRYSTGWEPLDPFQTLILGSDNEEWNWFPSGVARMEEDDLWVIAYTHMDAEGEADEDARGRLALFDGGFNLLQLHQVSLQATYRPHVLAVGKDIILAFDAGPVVLESWAVVPAGRDQ